MHLADGVLTDSSIAVGLNLLGAAAVGVALTRTQGDARKLVWTGTLAAFVLAAQALNVPAVPGASAHMIGAGLLTLTLGAGQAIVALSGVLLVQALLLGDGGITVLGLNALNLAVLPVCCIQGLRWLLGNGRRALLATGLLGTLLGNLLGALSLGGALVLGAGAPLGFTLTWLVGVQGLAGLAEGALTALTIGSLLKNAPGLLELGPIGRRSLDQQPEPPRGARGIRWAALALAVTLALLPFASGKPDALEVVVERLQATP